MFHYKSPLEARCLDEASIENVYNHVLWLDRNTPRRIAGGGQDRLAAEYIVERMNEYGLDAKVWEFETYNAYPGEGNLRVVEPVEKSISCVPCVHIDATPPGGVVAELVYVGPGGEADYAGKDVRGKLVLAEVSYAPATPEKARIAWEHGALGMVLMNWGPAEYQYIPWRGLKAVWGNPTPETWKRIPQLVAVSTTRAEGEYLRDLVKQGPVRMRIECTSNRAWGTVYQPVAEIRPAPGSPEADQVIVVSGHLDSWEPGTTDNATGNAIMLEVARVLASHRAELRRSVAFCFWNGHEIAEAAGSTYFVDTWWDRLNRAGVAYLNIDSPGMKQATILQISSSPELSEFHGAIERRVLGAEGERLSLGRTGDQSFFGIGVPSITGRISHAQHLVDAWHGATLGWWNHTSQENLDKVDIDNLGKETSLWTAYVLTLATTPVLPQRMAPLAVSLAERLKNVATDPDPVGLADLLPVADSLVRRAGDLDRRADDIAARHANAGGPERASLEPAVRQVNGVLLRLSRILTSPSRTVSGRYAQDSYGLSDLSAPLPMFARYGEFQKMDPDSLEYRLWRTHYLRCRNRLSDALQDATWTIDTVAALLDRY